MVPADTEDDDDYSQNDNDFATVIIDATDLDFSDLTGYKLYLIVDAGLDIWADVQKKPLAEATNDPGGSSGTGNDATDDVYWWTIGTDTFGDAARTFHVEGTATGAREVRWQLRKSDGTTILARDTIEINVEKIVWPNQDPTADWDAEDPTSEWNGFELAEGWFISSSLCNIINGTNGYIRTEYPKETSTDRWEGTIDHTSYAELDLAKLCGTETWQDDVTIRIELTYEFEQSPNITVGDFVDTNLEDRWQASFFHNSGVKIENRAEIQIFDTAALLNAIDGSQETIDGDDEVSVIGDPDAINADGQNPAIRVKLDHGGPEWRTEEADQINSLISGIPYAYDDLDYLAGETNMERLDRAPKGAQTMIIDVTKDQNDDYDFTVTIGEGDPKQYHVPGGAGDPDSVLYLQSHWGSGVKFTSAKVKKLP